MGRPKKHQRRDKQINVKLTQHEYAWVCTRATLRNIAAGEFAREQLLWERPHRARAHAPGQLDPLLIPHLSRIGNNLNQITRRMHQLDIEAPAQLEPTLEVLRQTLSKIARDDR